MAESGYGVVRGVAPPYYNEGSTSQIAINARGDQLVALSEAALTEIARGQNSWYVSMATGSAFTNVAAMPTTLAELTLKNNEPGDGKSYVIDAIWWLSITSVTALANVSIVYQVNTAAVVDDTAQLISSPTGAVYGGRASRAVSDTTMVANKWCVAAGASTAAASIGSSVVANINGGIILAPSFTLGVNAVAGTATGTSIMGINWHEVKLAES